jgi:hypothetical protein
LAIEEEARVHFLSLGYSFEQECLSQFGILLAAAFFLSITAEGKFPGQEF